MPDNELRNSDGSKPSTRSPTSTEPSNTSESPIRTAIGLTLIAWSARWLTLAFWIAPWLKPPETEK